MRDDEILIEFLRSLDYNFISRTKNQWSSRQIVTVVNLESIRQ